MYVINVRAAVFPHREILLLIAGLLIIIKFDMELKSLSSSSPMLFKNPSQCTHTDDYINLCV